MWVHTFFKLVNTFIFLSNHVYKKNVVFGKKSPPPLPPLLLVHACCRVGKLSAQFTDFFSSPSLSKINSILLGKITHTPQEKVIHEDVNTVRKK